MDCILYHTNGNHLGSDNGLVVRRESPCAYLFKGEKIMMLVIYFQMIQLCRVCVHCLSIIYVSNISFFLSNYLSSIQKSMG